MSNEILWKGKYHDERCECDQCNAELYELLGFGADDLLVAAGDNEALMSKETTRAEVIDILLAARDAFREAALYLAECPLGDEVQCDGCESDLKDLETGLTQTLAFLHEYLA